MRKVLTIAFGCLLTAAQAQVTFREFQMPENTGAKNYRLVVDYYSDQQVFFPVKQAGKVYAKNTASSGFTEIAEGLYITAFYANNGDLYLVENTDASGYEPHLYKSTDNGQTLSEEMGVAGRFFQRDQFGTLYYSVPGGFKYSVDNGETFKTVATPKEVFSAVRSPNGKLFYTTDNLELFSSINNGSAWDDNTKTYNFNPFLETHLWWKNDTLYLQTGSSFSYTSENSTKWTNLTMPFTSIITNVTLSPDNVFYCTSPYGFFSSQAPVTRNWTLLNNNQARAQETIYNSYIAITDSTMYYNCYVSGNNTSNYQVFYAPRIPNVIRAVETVGEQQFNIFPNPASSKIQIRNENGKGQFRIYDIQGKIMLTETITGANQTIDIQPLNPGIYIWQTENRKGKLVVQ